MAKDALSPGQESEQEHGETSNTVGVEADSDCPFIVLYIIDPFSFGVEGNEASRLAMIGILRCYQEMLKVLPEDLQNRIHLQASFIVKCYSWFPGTGEYVALPSKIMMRLIYRNWLLRRKSWYNIAFNLAEIWRWQGWNTRVKRGYEEGHWIAWSGVWMGNILGCVGDLIWGKCLTQTQHVVVEGILSVKYPTNRVLYAQKWGIGSPWWHQKNG